MFMMGEEDGAVSYGVGRISDGAAHGHGCVWWWGVIEGVGVAAGDSEAPPPARLGMVPAVRGVDACMGSVRESGAVHVRVERVHMILPSFAGRTCSRNGQAGVQLFIVWVCKVRDDICLATQGRE